MREHIPAHNVLRCDQCKASVNTVGDMDLPDGWAYLMINHAKYGKEAIHLCPDCWNGFTSWANWKTVATGG